MQQELRCQQKKDAKPEFALWQQASDDNYVGICIGRNGDLLFSEGAHRLVIAKLLGLSKIGPKEVSLIKIATTSIKGMLRIRRKKLPAMSIVLLVNL